MLKQEVEDLDVAFVGGIDLVKTVGIIDIY